MENITSSPELITRVTTKWPSLELDTCTLFAVVRWMVITKAWIKTDIWLIRDISNYYLVAPFSDGCVSYLDRMLSCLIRWQTLRASERVHDSRSQTHFTSPHWRPSQCLIPFCQVLSIRSRGKHNENASLAVHCTDGPIMGTSHDSRCQFILSQLRQKIGFSVAHQQQLYGKCFDFDGVRGGQFRGKKNSWWNSHQEMADSIMKDLYEPADWRWWTVSVGQFVQFSRPQTSGSVSYWLQNDLRPWAYPSCPIHPADIYNLQDFGRGFPVSWGAGSVHTGALWHSWNIYLRHHVRCL